MKQIAKDVIERFGFEVHKIRCDATAFDATAMEIYRRHFAQTEDDVAALKQKYEQPVLGEVSVYEAMRQLAEIVDVTDNELGAVPQLVHALQVIEGMEEAGIRDPEYLATGLIHDLGKIVCLQDERPENVFCVNAPIGEYEPGVGLDNCILQWNHDEFIYSRMKDHLPDHLSWLLRYHSIKERPCRPYFNARDDEYYSKYLDNFKKFDVGTKSKYHFPRKKLADYKGLLEEVFPDPVIL